MQFGDINFFRQSQGVQQNNRSEVAFPTKITAQGQFYLCVFQCMQQSKPDLDFPTEISEFPAQGFGNSESTF